MLQTPRREREIERAKAKRTTVKKRKKAMQRKDAKKKKPTSGNAVENVGL
jgi:hypothetical protein